MRVNRRFLYWGVFFVAMGGVMVAADLRGVDAPTLERALGLWPLAVVAVGVAIVVRRTRFNPSAWVVAAAMPGLLLGGALTVAPPVPIDCGGGQPASFATSQGTFDGPATIDVTSGCGSLAVTAAAGSGWRLEAGNTADATAHVSATGTSLSVGTARRAGWSRGRDVWRLTLPTSRIDRLNLDVNSGEAAIELAGAQVGALELRTSAADAVVSLGDASVDSLSAVLNAGVLSIDLPAGHDLTGSLEANVGSLKVCVPGGLGVRVDDSGSLKSSSYRGLVQNGGVWQSPDYALAAHRADLSVRVNLGSVEFNPIGGCK